MKKVLITGSTDGIGRETARKLLMKGFYVLLHGRSQNRCLPILQSFRETYTNVDCVVGDLASFKSVRYMAEEVKSKVDHLDVLINNAGIFNPVKEITEDGYEKTLQVNHLSHFLLTYLLFPLVRGGRIINVSSMAHASSIDFDNLNGEKYYDPYDAYSRSKLCNILFAFYLARLVKNTGTTVNALHPGVINTKLLISGWGAIGADVERGAETSVYLASSPDVANITGEYFVNKRVAKAASIAYDIEVQEKCWKISEMFTGVKWH